MTESGSGGEHAAFEPLRDLDRLIHEPARLMILSYLYIAAGADFTFLARQTGLTLGNLSSHVTKLEEAGYVEVEKRFKGKRPNTLLRLTDKGRAEFTAYRDRLEQALRGLASVPTPHPQ